MLVQAQLLCPDDIGWLVDHATVDGETLTLMTSYGLHPRRNQRQDTVVHAARAEALWRGCRVHVSGGGRCGRLPVGRRENLVVHIEPPRNGPDDAGSFVPRRPRPSAPSGGRRLHPPRASD